MMSSSNSIDVLKQRLLDLSEFQYRDLYHLCNDERIYLKERLDEEEDSIISNYLETCIIEFEDLSEIFKVIADNLLLESKDN